MPSAELSPPNPPGKEEFDDSVLRAIHEVSPDGILVVDTANIIVSHNRRFLEIWDIPFPDNERLANLSGSSDLPILASVLERVADSGQFLKRVRELYESPDENDHCEIALKDGRTLERYSTVVRRRNGEYLGRVWFFRDVTSRKRMETQLINAQEATEATNLALLKALQSSEHRATHDSLTGLLNRAAIIQALDVEISRWHCSESPFSICLIDVDHFKIVNDRHGHLVGDEVLKHLSRQLRTLTRAGDLVGRYGGEEFLIVAPNCKPVEAAHLADRMRRAVEIDELRIEQMNIPITLSIGISASSALASTTARLLQAADSALYKAKAMGRNRVEVYSAVSTLNPLCP